MQSHSELIQWFRRMGFDGDIPESLGPIYNQSTSFIWDGLMQNARPKQEVDNLRNNIIIHRLRSKELSKQDEFLYPIKEIDLYKKKQYLEMKRSNLSAIIEEKRHKLNSLSQSNKMKYIVIEKLKARSKENEEREYLLNKKCEMLEKNIREAEETLSLAKNLTPIELEENSNTKEVTETLEKCAEKLEKLLPKIPPPSVQQYSTQKPFKFHTAQKQLKTQTTFEKYLIMSERKHSESVTVLKYRGSTIRKDQNNKENFGGDQKINRKLFDSSGVNSDKTEKGKRESLGLLPDSCFNNNNKDDFLESTKLVSLNFLSPTLSVFSEISTFKTSAAECETPSLDSGLSSLFSDCPKSETSIQSHLFQAQKQLKFKKLYNDDFVASTLKNLLYNHNRHIIWKAFQTLHDNLNLEFTRDIIFDSGKDGRSRSICRDDIAKLQFQHIRTELQTIKLRFMAKELFNKINKKKKCVYTALSNQGGSQEMIENVERQFEQQLEDVGLDAVLAEMKKEINSAKRIEDNTDLQVTLQKVSQVKNDIDRKIASIRHYVEGINETLDSMIHTRETTVACVQKLGPFVEDMSWSAPLTQNFCSSETKAFQNFPLEYNRRCIYTDSRMYYRDIAGDIPSDVELDSESLQMLTSVLESPFSPPEMVLLNVLKSKMKLDALKSLPKHSKDINYTKYSLQDLQAQESYVQYALDKLNSLLYSTSSNKTVATADLVKQVMEIWLEMPVKDFISPKRMLEGKDYKYYEKHYDKFYNNI